MTAQPLDDTQAVPSSHFPYEAVPLEDRFAAWSESIAPLFTPRVADDARPQDVSVATEAYALGDAVFGRSETHGVGGYRCLGNSPLRDRADAVLVQLYRAGGFVGTNGTEALRVFAGDVVVVDTTRVMTTTVSDSTILSFVLPRETLVRHAGAALAPCVIAGQSPAGRVLGHTFRATWEALPRATLPEGDALRGLLLGAIGGVLRDRPDAPARPPDAALATATLDALRAYIDARLDAPDLTPEHVGRAFACAPADLVRLFAPLGGVAGYIRRARLERAHAELLATSERVPVAEVARRWGFTSVTQFARLIRQAYGVSPGEARAQARAARRDHGPAVRAPAEVARWLPAYRDWFLRLGGELVPAA